MSILVVLEHAAGKLHRVALEALACGQHLGGELQLPVYTAIAGDDVLSIAGNVSAYQLSQVYALQHSLLRQYTPDGYSAACEQIIGRLAPQYVVFPHTYQVRDYAPKVATRSGSVLVSDVTEIDTASQPLTLRRQLFQGKLIADVQVTGSTPIFLSVQAGAFRSDQLVAAASAAPVEIVNIDLEASHIRTQAGEPFQEGDRTLDLSSAATIVAVGRGIQDKENISIVKELADEIRGELAASRPVCDNGWLPMDRQVGSSGQTVSPNLYIAVGISGAIQHLVGMKGAKTIVAINKDREAPIFEIADYGAVGDLFEIVPALTEEIRKARS